MSITASLLPFGRELKVMIASSSARIREVVEGEERMKQSCQKSVGIAFAVETCRRIISKRPMSVSGTLCFRNVAARTLVICAAVGERSCLDV